MKAILTAMLAVLTINAAMADDLCDKTAALAVSIYQQRANGLSLDQALNILSEQRAYTLGWVVKSVFRGPADTPVFIIRGDAMAECRRRKN